MLTRRKNNNKYIGAIMKKLQNGWVGKTISERVEWYDDEMSNLYNYLSDKKPFSKEYYRYAATVLQNIKYRMRTDLKTVGLAGLNDTRLNYLDAIGLAYIELEAIGNDFRNWFESLGRANELIAIVNMNNE